MARRPDTITLMGSTQFLKKFDEIYKSLINFDKMPHEQINSQITNDLTVLRGFIEREEAYFFGHSLTKLEQLKANQYIQNYYKLNGEKFSNILRAYKLIPDLVYTLAEWTNQESHPYVMALLLDSNHSRELFIQMVKAHNSTRQQSQSPYFFSKHIKPSTSVLYKNLLPNPDINTHQLIEDYQMGYRDLVTIMLKLFDGDPLRHLHYSYRKGQNIHRKPTNYVLRYFGLMSYQRNQNLQAIQNSFQTIEDVIDFLIKLILIEYMSQGKLGENSLADTGSQLLVTETFPTKWTWYLYDLIKEETGLNYFYKRTLFDSVLDSPQIKGYRDF